MTFRLPLQKLDGVRLCMTSACSLKKRVKTLSVTILWKLRLLKLHRVRCLDVRFLVTLLKILTFTFPSRPARQNNNKPSDRQVHLRLFYTQTLTRQFLLAQPTSRRCGPAWNRQESRKCALAGRVIKKGGKWLSQPIRSAVSKVAAMSEALSVPDLGWTVRAPRILVSTQTLYFWQSPRVRFNVWYFYDYGGA